MGLPVWPSHSRAVLSSDAVTMRVQLRPNIISATPNVRGLSLPDQTRVVMRRHLIGCSYLFIARLVSRLPARDRVLCEAARRSRGLIHKSSRPEGPTVGRNQLLKFASTPAGLPGPVLALKTGGAVDRNVVQALPLLILSAGQAPNPPGASRLSIHKLNVRGPE
jgi:hypothetical protein